MCSEGALNKFGNSSGCTDQYVVKKYYIWPKNVSGQRPHQSLPGPESHFICTPIKTQTIFGILCSRAFRTPTSKLVTLYNRALNSRFQQSSSVRAKTWKKWLLWQKPVSGYFYVTFPQSGVSPTQTGPQSVPGSRGTSSEVLRLNASTQFPWNSKKRENNMSTCQKLSSPNWPTESRFRNYPAL